MTFSGVCCVGIPTFACAPRPPACGATLTCACAMSALCQPGVTCSTLVTGMIPGTIGTVMPASRARATKSK